MKLSELRAAIRKMKGNPSIRVSLSPGVHMTLVLQKTPTLETLAIAYEHMGSADIGLTLDEMTGVISGPDSLEAEDAEMGLDHDEDGAIVSDPFEGDVEDDLL